MYLIYKTTNLITGEYYIGVHKCNNPYYFGSGVIIKRSISKYGRKNFIRETILYCDNAKEAFFKEKELLEELLIDNQCLNLSEGGKGGPNFSGRRHTEETKLKIAEKARNRKLSIESRNKISEKNRNRVISDEFRQKMVRPRKPMSDETKRKISESRKRLLRVR